MHVCIDSNPISLICMCILKPLQYSVDYYGFVLSFEMGKCEFSNFVIFEDYFVYSWSIAFSYKF